MVRKSKSTGQTAAAKRLPGKLHDRSRPKRKLSTPKKLIFGLTSTVVILAFLEIVLAVVGVRPLQAERDPYVGFEKTFPLFVLEPGDEQWVTALNKRDYFNFQTFSADKAPGTIRIFCLGGSTTYGRPFDDSTSYVGWLREFLNSADPNGRYEVINAGGISYASYRIANVLDELCDYDPDLFIVYTGHNEFLEQRTFRDLPAQSWLLGKFEQWLGQWRTYSVIEKVLTADVGSPEDIRKPKLPSEVDALLDHTSGPVDYHRDEVLQQQVVEHFEFNVRRMMQRTRSAGIGMLFVSPASNAKDFSPFKSEFRNANDESLEAEELRSDWLTLWQQAQNAEANDDLQAALDYLQDAEKLDDRRADLHFALGRLYLRLENFDAAAKSFQTAIDEDVCPLRAISPIESIIHRAAIDEQVPLIDFASVLRTDCVRRFGHQCLGSEYFVDHVHPNLETHRLLALAIIDAMKQLRMFDPTDAFRDEVIPDVSREIESRLNPEKRARGLTNLAQVLSWAGKQSEAGPAAIEAVRLREAAGLPDDPEADFYAGVHFAVLGMRDRAIELLQKVVKRLPNSYDAQWRLGLVLFEEKRWTEAREHLKRAVQLRPDDGEVRELLRFVELEVDHSEELGE